jgi:hypothetical protein
LGESGAVPDIDLAAGLSRLNARWPKYFGPQYLPRSSAVAVPSVIAPLLNRQLATFTASDADARCAGIH